MLVFVSVAVEQAMGIPNRMGETAAWPRTLSWAAAFCVSKHKGPEVVVAME